MNVEFDVVSALFVFKDRSQYFMSLCVSVVDERVCILIPFWLKTTTPHTTEMSHLFFILNTKHSQEVHFKPFLVTKRDVLII